MIMTIMMTEDKGAFGAAVLYRKQDDGLMLVIKVRDDGNVDNVDNGDHDDNDGGEGSFFGSRIVLEEGQWYDGRD